MVRKMTMTVQVEFDGAGLAEQRRVVVTQDLLRGRAWVRLWNSKNLRRYCFVTQEATNESGTGYFRE